MMIKKIKQWIIETFLPVWAKETVLKDLNESRQKIEALQAENERLRAYAAGLEYALRRRIIIKNEVSK